MFTVTAIATVVTAAQTVAVHALLVNRQPAATPILLMKALAANKEHTTATLQKTDPIVKSLVLCGRYGFRICRKVQTYVVI